MRLTRFKKAILNSLPIIEENNSIPSFILIYKKIKKFLKKFKNRIFKKFPEPFIRPAVLTKIAKKLNRNSMTASIRLDVQFWQKCPKCPLINRNHLARVSNPKDIVCMRVSGDSMYPTLKDGDIIVVDTSWHRADDILPLDGQLAVIVDDNDDVLVKRLKLEFSRFRGQKILTLIIALSDNPQVPAIIIYPKAHKRNPIIGRVELILHKP